MIPRAKILTAVTFSSAQTFYFKFSVSSQFDTNITATVAAGTYFVAGDIQSDDLLYALQAAVQAAIDAARPADDRTFVAWIDDNHKVNFGFEGTDFQGATKRQVQITWSSWSTDLMKALGQDSAATTTSLTTSDEPYHTLSYHHGYGFYCDEDGQTDMRRSVDEETPTSLQSIAISGHVKTQYFGSAFTNDLMLSFLEANEQGRTKVFSDGVGYGVQPPWPFNWNEPLECWFQDAMKGVRFRVYERNQKSIALASALGTTTGSTSTSLDDGTKSWTNDQWVGFLAHVPSFRAGEIDFPQSYYISDNDSNSLIIPNAHPSGYDAEGLTGDTGGVDYYVFDHRYQTYVLDLAKMKSFKADQQARALDRWRVSIPLLRYVA